MQHLRRDGGDCYHRQEQNLWAGCNVSLIPSNEIRDSRNYSRDMVFWNSSNTSQCVQAIVFFSNNRAGRSVSSFHLLLKYPNIFPHQHLAARLSSLIYAGTEEGYSFIYLKQQIEPTSVLMACFHHLPGP
jgi:hypothetical protein